NIYIADSGNDRVQKFDSTGHYLSQFGSAGNGPGQLQNPHGLDVDGLGNVYVADLGNNRIEKFDATGAFISRFGSNGTAEGQFDQPTDVMIDVDGNLVVADTNNNRMQEFDPFGNFRRMYGIGVADGSSTFQVCTESCSAGVASTDSSAVNAPVQVSRGSTL